MPYLQNVSISSHRWTHRSRPLVRDSTADHCQRSNMSPEISRHELAPRSTWRFPCSIYLARCYSQFRLPGLTSLALVVVAGCQSRAVQCRKYCQQCMLPQRSRFSEEIDRLPARLDALSSMYPSNSSACRCSCSPFSWDTSPSSPPSACRARREPATRQNRSADWVWLTCLYRWRLWGLPWLCRDNSAMPLPGPLSPVGEALATALAHPFPKGRLRRQTPAMRSTTVRPSGNRG